MLNAKLNYEVPYEAGFSSGVKYFTDLTEAVNFSKSIGYGEVNLCFKMPIYRDGVYLEDNIDMWKEAIIKKDPEC